MLSLCEDKTYFEKEQLLVYYFNEEKHEIFFLSQTAPVCPQLAGLNTNPTHISLPLFFSRITLLNFYFEKVLTHYIK